ncbi:MAG: 30S ribosomal protein S20 [Candidatus Sumerlaeaceae bacterium]
MPNIKSAKKRVKTNKRDEIRNRAAKSTLKTHIKTLEAMEPGDEQKKALRDVQALVARTKKRGILHKNKAARIQSRLAKRVNKAGAA